MLPWNFFECPIDNVAIQESLKGLYTTEEDFLRDLKDSDYLFIDCFFMYKKWLE